MSRQRRRNRPCCCQSRLVRQDAGNNEWQDANFALAVAIVAVLVSVCFGVAW